MIEWRRALVVSLAAGSVAFVAAGLTESEIMRTAAQAGAPPGMSGWQDDRTVLTFVVGSAA